MNYKVKQFDLTSEQEDFIKAIAKQYSLYDFISRCVCKSCQFDEVKVEEYLSKKAPIRSTEGLKDIDKAVDIINKHLDSGNRIRIIADYDVDGVTSLSLLWLVLTKVSTNIDYYIPDRHVDGYGLKSHIVEKASSDGVQLIITVDNGISAYDAVSLAKQKGMDVIITDHHDVVNSTLPTADAIVDPKQEDCTYPYKYLAGVGVAYKVSQALMQNWLQTGRVIKSQLTKQFINKLYALVGLGTVCDGMPLIEENRNLLLRGINALYEGAFPQLTDITKTFNVGTFGFVIGPRLNACGRITKADIAFKFLMTDIMNKDYPVIRQQIEQLNEDRKKMQDLGVEEADAILQEMSSIPTVIVITLEHCDEGVIGLVAADIVKKYHHPTIVFTKLPTGGYKGSGRSPETFNFCEQVSPYFNLLTSGGGHDSVCGLAADTEEQITQFTQAVQNISFNEEQYIGGDEITVYKVIDAEQPLGDFDLNQYVKQVNFMLPCGMGNPSPSILLKNVNVHISTRYPKGYILSEITIILGADRLQVNRWGDKTIPESYDGRAHIVLSADQRGLQIKQIELEKVTGFC